TGALTVRCTRESPPHCRRCWICCDRTCEWHQKRLNSLSDSGPNADEAAVRHRKLEKWSTTDSFRVLKCPIATAVRASAAHVQVPGWLSVSCGWIHCEILARITTDPPAGSKCALRKHVRPQEARGPRRPVHRAGLRAAKRASRTRGK